MKKTGVLITLLLSGCASTVPPRPTDVALLAQCDPYRIAAPSLAGRERLAAPSPDPPFGGPGRGHACIEIEIADEGQVTPVSVLATNSPEFGRNAMIALAKWRYEPASPGAEPGPTRTMIAVSYRRYGS